MFHRAPRLNDRLAANICERGEPVNILYAYYEAPDDEALEEVDWDDFFDTFEEKNLAFVFQEKPRTAK